MSDATIVRYEPCPKCLDGSCGSCGPASGEHAAPGVLLVVRHLRFIPCPQCEGGRKAYGIPAGESWQHNGCVNCGPSKHPMAAPGVVVEVVTERNARRWVPAMHQRKGDGPKCDSAGVPPDRLTSKKAEVTCKRCINQRTT
jgi:hypothetical protein